MEKNNHLKLSMLCVSSLGIYPLKFRKPIHNVLYKTYSYIIQIYLITFVNTGFIQIYFLDKSNLAEIATNLGVTLLYATAIAKVFACRGQGIKNLVCYVQKTEATIFRFEQTYLKEIYLHYVNLTHKAQKAVMIFTVITIFSYYLAPFLVRNTEPAYFNETIGNATFYYKMKELPLNSWFPFNRYKYYGVCYTLHVCAAWIGGFGTASVDIFIVGFITFATGQIKILQYCFKNSKNIADDLNKVNPNLSALDALRLTIGRCIDMHKALIKFVSDLDECIKMLMLLDFVVVTLQMAMLGLQMITAEHMIQLASSVEFLVTMFLVLLLFYCNANEIILESLAVSTSIWESDFLEFHSEIQKSLIVVMIRAQVPLKLHVGPFYAMSTTTALLIVRASYSYVALIYQVYGK